MYDTPGLTIKIAKKVDPYYLGTFSGEEERSDSQYNKAKLKTLKAFDLYPHVEIAIDSKGAFNSNAACPFIPVNTEILMLIDRKNNLERLGR